MLVEGKRQGPQGRKGHKGKKGSRGSPCRRPSTATRSITSSWRRRASWGRRSSPATRPSSRAPPSRRSGSVARHVISAGTNPPLNHRRRWLRHQTSDAGATDVGGSLSRDAIGRVRVGRDARRIQWAWRLWTGCELDAPLPLDRRGAISRASTAAGAINRSAARSGGVTAGHRALDSVSACSSGHARSPRRPTGDRENRTIGRVVDPGGDPRSPGAPCHGRRLRQVTAARGPS